MNHTATSICGIGAYLSLCATSKILLLVPGFGLNIFILVSLLSCLLSRRSKIRGNVSVFILGSTCCNLVNLSLWPMTIHWKKQGRWLLGTELCEFMVSAKHVTSSAAFHYVSFITFSIYLTVVCGRGRLVSSRLFLALELLFPLLPIALTELSEWLLGNRVEHFDAADDSCFSFINDRVMRIMVLVKVVVFLPLIMYFYVHVLYTIASSAKVMHRSQVVNMKLARVFSLISLITLAAHLPGAVFSLMEEPTICQEMVKDFLLDLPLLSSPIALLCMNKELQSQCLRLLRRQPAIFKEPGKSAKDSEEQLRSTTTGDVVTISGSRV